MLEVKITVVPSDGSPGHICQSLAIWNVSHRDDSTDCDYDYALSHQYQSPSLEDAPSAVDLSTKTSLVQVHGRVNGHNRVYESPATLVRKCLNDAAQKLHAEPNPEVVQ